MGTRTPQQDMTTGHGPDEQDSIAGVGTSYVSDILFPLSTSPQIFVFSGSILILID
jgi:hypothetical protein